jgi:ABC-type cobalamin/Fe3+-siderophores transport system ATPase subunit
MAEAIVGVAVDRGLKHLTQFTKKAQRTGSASVGSTTAVVPRMLHVARHDYALLLGSSVIAYHGLTAAFAGRRLEPVLAMLRWEFVLHSLYGLIRSVSRKRSGAPENETEADGGHLGRNFHLRGRSRTSLRPAPVGAASRPVLPPPKSLQCLDPESAANRPIVIVIYLHCLESGQTLHTTVSEEASIAADEFLAVARSRVRGGEGTSAEAALRSDDYLFFGLDESLNPLAGPGCGRLLVPSTLFMQYSYDVERMFSAVIQPATRPNLEMPLELRRDIVTLRLASHYHARRSINYEVLWYAQKLAAFPDFTNSAVCRLSRRFAPDGFVLPTERDQHDSSANALSAAVIPDLRQRLWRTLHGHRAFEDSAIDVAAELGLFRYVKVDELYETLRNAGTKRAPREVHKMLVDLASSIQAQSACALYLGTLFVQQLLAIRSTLFNAMRGGSEWDALWKMHRVLADSTSRRGGQSLSHTKAALRAVANGTVLSLVTTAVELLLGQFDSQLKNTMNVRLRCRVIFALVTADFASLDSRSFAVLKQEQNSSSSRGRGNSGLSLGAAVDQLLSAGQRTLSQAFGYAALAWCGWQDPVLVGLTVGFHRLGTHYSAYQRHKLNDWQGMVAGDEAIRCPLVHDRNFADALRPRPGLHIAALKGHKAMQAGDTVRSVLNRHLCIYTKGKVGAVPQYGLSCLLAAATTSDATSTPSTVYLLLATVVSCPSTPRHVGRWAIPVYRRCIEAAIAANLTDAQANERLLRARCDFVQADIDCGDVVEREREQRERTSDVTLTQVDVDARLAAHEKRRAQRKLVRTFGEGSAAQAIRNVFGETDKFATIRASGCDTSVVTTMIITDVSNENGTRIQARTAHTVTHFSIHATRRSLETARDVLIGTHLDRKLGPDTSRLARDDRIAMVAACKSVSEQIFLERDRQSDGSLLEREANDFADVVQQIESVLHTPHSIDRIEFRRTPLAALIQPVAVEPNRGASITFEHVSFAYPSDPGRLILDDVSFHAPAGALAAIVGESGCGKSTLISLLLRVYEPTAGRVLIGGVDVRELPPRWLRRRLGYVGQACGLLPLRITENLRLGSPGASQAAQWAALERACARRVVERRPGQLEAVADASELSGGERQRLVLARALLRGASEGVLANVLDEATSALDVETERRVQHALSGSGVTTLAVAHRLFTVRAASLVVVLGAGGRVMEQGSFAELAARPGSQLARFVQLQALTAREDTVRGLQAGLASLQAVTATVPHAADRLARLSHAISHLSLAQ